MPDWLKEKPWGYNPLGVLCHPTMPVASMQRHSLSHSCSFLAGVPRVPRKKKKSFFLLSQCSHPHQNVVWGERSCEHKK